jgi:N1221-like protein/Domain of unknown function (DUF3402)
LLFGDTTTTLPKVKSHVRKILHLPLLDKTKSTITTNPLDYHLFRQEIISKYPTYVPPPLPVRESLIAEPTVSTSQAPRTTAYYEGSKGPVHIATPAPSPPPSPKLKRSIFQTDQTVPLLLPGNGEVPKAIEEAGALYTERMRISSATAQMWDEKDKFQGYVKGFWDYELEDEFVRVELEEDEISASILQRIEDTYVNPPSLLSRGGISLISGFCRSGANFLERVITAFTRHGCYVATVAVGKFHTKHNPLVQRSR